MSIRRRIVVTGDRNWTNRLVIYNALDKYCYPSYQTIVTQGSAVGADTIAGSCADELYLLLGRNVINDPHPAEWYDKQGRFCKWAGPVRNRKMLTLKDPVPDLVLAFHNNITDSKGTKDCVLTAIERKISVILHTESTITFIFPLTSFIKMKPEQQLLQALEIPL